MARDGRTAPSGGLHFELRRLPDAVPSLGIALAYLVTGMAGVSFLGFDGKWLARILQVEFYVVLFGYFILKRAVAWKRAEDSRRITALLRFLGVLTIPVLLSFGAGPSGPLLFLLATLGTYWVPWRNWHTREVVGVATVRWFVSAGLYALSVFVLFNPFDLSLLWDDSLRTHVSGFVYFTLLGFLEWAGFMETDSPDAPLNDRLP